MLALSFSYLELFGKKVKLAIPDYVITTQKNNNKKKTNNNNNNKINNNINNKYSNPIVRLIFIPTLF